MTHNHLKKSWVGFGIISVSVKCLCVCVCVCVCCLCAARLDTWRRWFCWRENSRRNKSVWSRNKSQAVQKALSGSLVWGFNLSQREYPYYLLSCNPSQKIKRLPMVSFLGWISSLYNELPDTILLYGQDHDIQILLHVSFHMYLVSTHLNVASIVIFAVTTWSRSGWLNPCTQSFISTAWIVGVYVEKRICQKNICLLVISDGNQWRMQSLFCEPNLAICEPQEFLWFVIN